MIRRTVYFSGHVQGVGFRFITRQLSAEFQVKGFVRNLRDGRVEVVLEGEMASVDAFVARVRDKMQGYVDQIEEMTHPATGEFEGFEIRR